ncbi:MAG: hypothetical protein C5B52_16020, partial [Bacteroidetes bacterium]
MDVKQFLIAVIFFFGSINTLLGQCPDKVFFWNRIQQLRAQQVPVPEQMKELQELNMKMKSCGFQNDSAYAFLLQRIGVMYYLQGNYQDAIASTKEAIKIIKINYSKGYTTPERLIHLYQNLTFSYDYLNLRTEKNQALDSCIVISERANYLDDDVMNALEDRLVYLFNVGDYHRCIGIANLGLNIINKFGRDTTQFAQNILTWKINALNEIGEDSIAELEARNAIKHFLQVGNMRSIGTYYSALGIVLEHQKKFKDAVQAFQSGYEYNLKSGHKPGCAAALGEMAYVISHKLHERSKARPIYFKALLYADSIQAINILGNLANEFLIDGKFDIAFSFFQRAFDSIHVGTNELRLLADLQKKNNPTQATYIVGVVLDKGSACLAAYRQTNDSDYLRRAQSIFSSADKLISELKLVQSETQSRLFWRKSSLRLYENAIEACYLLHDTTSAFYFFEKSKSVLLIDQLDEQHLIKESDQAELSDLKKKIAQIELKNEGQTHPSQAAELINLKLELDSVMGKIKMRNPLYIQNLNSKDFISIEAVRKYILKDHEALIEIFNGDSSIYTLVITKSQMLIRKIEKDIYDSLVTKYTELVSDSRLINKQTAEFQKISFALYQIIFDDNRLPPGRIIISPGGNYFPFECLITREKPLRYMVQDYAISYTYSARYLLGNSITNDSRASKNFMGIAPVNYFQASGLNTLPGSDESMERIYSQFNNGTKFSGSQATKQNFLNEYFKHQVVQLYTHAADNSNNGEPIIYFSDSLMYLSELIPGLEPATRLIVISACESGSGKLYEGEGVFSFNRGFAAIGVPSSVTNLWSVDDKSTYRITELFYRHIANGEPYDIALQLAKNEFMNSGSKDDQLPYYWAGPVLVGVTN